jgi:hypothetical protein
MLVIMAGLGPGHPDTPGPAPGVLIGALDGVAAADHSRFGGIRSYSVRAAFVSAALAGALAGCIYFPEPVQGLPGGGGWVALPLRGWIAESAVKAEGIAGCFAAECAPRVGVGIFRATGEEARIVSGILREPERLVRFIEARDRADTAPQRKAVRTVASVEKLSERGLSGFARRCPGRTARASFTPPSSPPRAVRACASPSSSARAGRACA